MEYYTAMKKTPTIPTATGTDLANLTMGRRGQKKIKAVVHFLIPFTQSPKAGKAVASDREGTWGAVRAAPVLLIKMLVTGPCSLCGISNCTCHWSTFLYTCLFQQNRKKLYINIFMFPLPSEALWGEVLRCGRAGLKDNMWGKHEKK